MKKRNIYWRLALRRSSHVIDTCSRQRHRASAASHAASMPTKNEQDQKREKKIRQTNKAVTKKRVIGSWDLI